MLCDEIITVSDEDAFEMVRKLGEIEGLLVGISSGANIYAAIEIAKKKYEELKELVGLHR